MRLIDADELKTAFPCGEYVRTECVRSTIDHMATIVPSAQLIQCKECVYGNKMKDTIRCELMDYLPVECDHFCSWAERRQEEKLKKKMLFSDRQEIVRGYKKWCLINNVDGCEESFLEYLCIKGYIDG